VVRQRCARDLVGVREPRYFMSFSASFLRELLRPDPTNQSCVGGAPARIGRLS
jgi:hypothetical protein